MASKVSALFILWLGFVASVFMKLFIMFMATRNLAERGVAITPPESYFAGTAGQMMIAVAVVLLLGAKLIIPKLMRVPTMGLVAQYVLLEGIGIVGVLASFLSHSFLVGIPFLGVSFFGLLVSRPSA